MADVTAARIVVRHMTVAVMDSEPAVSMVVNLGVPIMGDMGDAVTVGVGMGVPTRMRTARIADQHAVSSVMADMAIVVVDRMTTVPMVMHDRTVAAMFDAHDIVAVRVNVFGTAMREGVAMFGAHAFVAVCRLTVMRIGGADSIVTTAARMRFRRAREPEIAREMAVVEILTVFQMLDRHVRSLSYRRCRALAMSPLMSRLPRLPMPRTLGSVECEARSAACSVLTPKR